MPHTKGPWANEFGSAATAVIAIQNGRRIEIPHVPYAAASVGREEARGNAIIIAAAPEMLAALKKIAAIEVRADNLRGSGMVDNSYLIAMRAMAETARVALIRADEPPTKETE